MFERVRDIFRRNKADTSQIANAVASATMQSFYRTRYNMFSGEKMSGGMNYPTAFGIDRATLVTRSMRAYVESAQARAAINRLNDCVVNTGLMLEATPEADLIGIDSEEAKRLATKIEARFTLWANSKECDATGNNTLGQIERILFNNQLVKGDYFAAIEFNPLARNKINPVQLKIIKPERVCTPTDSKLLKAAEDSGNSIISGIEINRDGKFVAIYVKNIDQGRPTWQRIPFRNQKTGRQIIIHGNQQRFGDEVRGIPALAYIAHELEKITDYSLLELMAAVANATIAAIVKPSDSAPATNPFPANTFIPPTLLNTTQGQTAVAQGSDVKEAGYSNLGKTELKNTGGLLVSSLNPGEDLVSYDTKRPNVSFGDFLDNVTKQLSASLSIPYEVLLMLFGSNYSASRASLKLFWQSLEVWRNELVSDFLRPLYSAWLLGEVASGSLLLPGYDTPAKRAAWESANWVGIPAPSIDPLKEAKAAQVRINEGITTREHEQQRAGNRAGFEPTIRRLAKENEELANAREPIIEQEAMK